MFIEQPPWFFRALYPQAIFRMDPNERAVYLTFDDGPIPEVTPWVLELLKKHDIKATFFMVGDNIRKHPDEYRMVVEHGHRIGNHTFNHIRGFEYSNPDYLANTRKVDEMIHSDLFRPPHGHMGFRQYYTLRHHYRIIMWDLVTRDYSKRMRPGTGTEQRKTLRTQRLYHHFPRLLEIMEQREPAICPPPCHRVSESGRVYVQSILITDKVFVHIHYEKAPLLRPN